MFLQGFQHVIVLYRYVDNMWVIISTSSIKTTNFRKSPLNHSSSVIQLSGSLVTPTN